MNILYTVTIDMPGNRSTYLVKNAVSEEAARYKVKAWTGESVDNMTALDVHFQGDGGDVAFLSQR